MNMPKRASLNHFRRAAFCSGDSAEGAAEEGRDPEKTEPAAIMAKSEDLRVIVGLRVLGRMPFRSFCEKISG